MTVLLLNEQSTYLSRPVDKSQAVCISNGYFACYINQPDTLKKIKKFKNGVYKKDTPEDLENKTSLLKQMASPRYQNVLFDVNFHAPKGSLIGICGPVGAGKTSLMSAILGQIRMTEGKLCREGTCAYVSQQAWLMNATLKENILFGEKFNAKRYFAVLHCCALNKDIDTLPGADETEIGEKGINVSGGQKQRIALARALYSNRDIYLLDDPLSAVDPQIAIHIFENCILKALNRKTVIFVSHKLEFLSRCDEIVFMKDGRILERGNHRELMSKSSDYKVLVETYANQDEMMSAGVVSGQNKSPEKTRNRLTRDGSAHKNKEGGDGGKTLMTSEKIEQGSLSCHTYISYMKACGGFLVSMLVIFFLFLNVGATAFSSWWLAMWIKDGSGTISREGNISVNNFVNESIFNNTLEEFNSTVGEDLTTMLPLNEVVTETATTYLDNLIDLDLNDTSTLSPIFDEFANITNLTASDVEGNLADNPDFHMYQLVYCLCIGAIFLTGILRGYSMTKATLHASANFHNALLQKVLKAKLVFFETVPIGRYQNLFSKDLDEVETRLPVSIESVMHGFWQITFSLLFICLAFPAFAFVLVPVIFLYYLVNRSFRTGVRELKRIDNVTRTPIFSNVSCTVSGLDTIHAFNKEKAFLQKFITSFDLNATSMFMHSVSNRWLAVRLDAIAILVIFATALFIVIMHGRVPPALAGLAISYASSLSGLFQYTVRLLVDSEVKFLSVERINSCIKSLEQEGGHGPKGIPPDHWPEKGAISFRNVKLRYRPGLPFSLNDVTFYIQPSEKIGIVGRSGAGKSSLISALFRIVEICDGNITIDNFDISKLDQNTLRDRLSLIPQDPVLLSGTVRFNLDPFGVHKDKDIWDALEKVKIKERISASEGKLQTKVSSGGDNFSAGEIQQLCLARALLKKSKIMVFDEATAALDLDTEAIVYQTIFNYLKDCTVLIIAHRLETVKSCNRILVIDNGKVAEFDEPSVLLENQNSLFYKMAVTKPHQSAE